MHLKVASLHMDNLEDALSTLSSKIIIFAMLWMLDLKVTECLECLNIDVARKLQELYILWLVDCKSLLTVNTLSRSEVLACSCCIVCEALQLSFMFFLPIRAFWDLGLQVWIPRDNFRAVWADQACSLAQWRWQNGNQRYLHHTRNTLNRNSWSQNTDWIWQRRHSDTMWYHCSTWFLDL